MDNKTFLEILRQDPMQFTLGEIEDIMDEEIAKPAEEMDADLIDLCADIITKAKTPAPKKSGKIKTVKHKKHKAFKSLLAAAIILAFAASTVTAFAEAGYIDIPFVKIFSDHAEIDYSGKDSAAVPAVTDRAETALYKELKEGGIDNILLPSALYNMEYEELFWQNDDMSKMAAVNYYDDDIMLFAALYADKKWTMNPDIQGAGMKCETLNINGVDVYIFEEKGLFPWQTKTNISYEIGLTQFNINSKMTMAEAKEFVKTMG